MSEQTGAVPEADPLGAVRDRLTGILPPERIRSVVTDRPAAHVIEAFLDLAELTTTVSDALDALGVGARVPGSVLQRRVAGKRICGPAITVRYINQSGSVGRHIADNERPRMAEGDFFAVGEPGDVAVFDCNGLTHGAVMGSIASLRARGRGIAGCIVDGSVRDLDTIESYGFPVWSRGITPAVARHRLEAIEVNGTVSLGGALVRFGDVVAADGTGVVVIPAESVTDVLEICLASDRHDARTVETLIDLQRPN